MQHFSESLSANSQKMYYKLLELSTGHPVETSIWVVCFQCAGVLWTCKWPTQILKVAIVHQETQIFPEATTNIHEKKLLKRGSHELEYSPHASAEKTHIQIWSLLNPLARHFVRKTNTSAPSSAQVSQFFSSSSSEVSLPHISLAVFAQLFTCLPNYSDFPCGFCFPFIGMSSAKNNTHTHTHSH